MLKELMETAKHNPGIIVADVLGCAAVFLASLAFFYF